MEPEEKEPIELAEDNIKEVEDDEDEVVIIN